MANVTDVVCLVFVPLLYSILLVFSIISSPAHAWPVPKIMAGSHRKTKGESPFLPQPSVSKILALPKVLVRHNLGSKCVPRMPVSFVRTDLKTVQSDCIAFFMYFLGLFTCLLHDIYFDEFKSEAALVPSSHILLPLSF